MKESDLATPEIIKKQYRLFALKYHPDKNKEENACETFQKINEAYCILCNSNLDANGMEEEDEQQEQEQETGNIKRVKKFEIFLKLFLNHILKNNVNQQIIQMIVSNVLNMCDSKSLEYLKNVDLPLLNKIYSLLHKYRPYLHISTSYLEKIKIMVKEKENEELSNKGGETSSSSTSNTSMGVNPEYIYCEKIILHPWLYDLLNGNVYKLVYNDETYMVPLWHHELVYETSIGDLLVNCIPELPENMTLDENDDLHIELQIKIESILDKTHIPYRWNIYTWEIPTEKLKYVTTCQIVVTENTGTRKIKEEDDYNIENKNSIFWHIYLSL